MSDVMDVGPGTVSIKFGKGYEAPLFVARGSVQEMGEQLIEAFGLNPNKDDTLAAIVAQASAVAGGLQVAHQPPENGGLGGQPVQQQEQPQKQGWGSSNQRAQSSDNVQQGSPQGGQTATAQGTPVRGFAGERAKNPGQEWRAWDIPDSSQRGGKRREFVNKNTPGWYDVGRALGIQE
jgi:hypothetical protein